jgi:hypothetical protein
MSPTLATVYRDARTILRLCAPGSLTWSQIRRIMSDNGDRAVDAVDYCLRHEWIMRRTVQLDPLTQSTDYVVTGHGLRI